MLKLHTRSKILDYGCGTGDLLLKLRYFGFRNLLGMDAFIERDIVYTNGVRVLKRPIEDVDTQFDLIILNHSFEHLPNPCEFLDLLRSRTKRGKFCLIRMPVLSYAWQTYGKDWSQLDAPRHFYLYTENGFVELAMKHGFVVEKVIYDSFAYYQFWASELYKRNIPLRSADEDEENVRQSLFSKEDFQKWETAAIKLNREKQGDQACYYLRVP